MKRSLVIAAGLASVLLLCADSHSKTKSSSDIMDNVYAKLGVGGMKYDKFKEADAYVKKAPDTGVIGNVGVGYKFNDFFRSDVNFQYGEVDYSAKDKSIPSTIKQTIKTMAIILNGYYDVVNYNDFIPYLTAGVGVGRNSVSDLKVSNLSSGAFKGKDTTNLVWNVGAGVKYDINKNFAVDAAYRYMDLGTIKTNDNTAYDPLIFKGGKQNIRGHQGVASLIYSF